MLGQRRSIDSKYFGGMSLFSVIARKPKTKYTIHKIAYPSKHKTF